jgi:hypothetical protein
MSDPNKDPFYDENKRNHHASFTMENEIKEK